MSPLDSSLAVASGAVSGAAALGSTIGAVNLGFTLLSAAIGAGVAYGVLKKGAEARDAEVAEVKAALKEQGVILSDIRERLANIEGWRDGR